MSIGTIKKRYAGQAVVLLKEVIQLRSYERGQYRENQYFMQAFGT